MTWTKLGDEWPDSARDLTDAAYRTHVDALCWSNRRGLDLVIPKRELRRFAETTDPDTAVAELVSSGWWEDRSDSWWIGVQFADWQQEAAVVKRKRDASALTSRRNRLHKVGDHTLCPPGRCPSLPAGDASQELSRDASRELSPGTGRDGAVQDGHGHAVRAVPEIEEGAGEGGPGGEPTFPEHCPKHAHDPHPPRCQDCGRARVAHRAAVTAAVQAPRPPRPPWCGTCDETSRRLELPDGSDAGRCPNCHPDPQRLAS